MPEICGVSLTKDEFENIEFAEISLNEVRELIGSENSTEALDLAMDKAQGEVSMGHVKRSFVLIQIT